MRSNRRRDTSVELVVRRILHARGARYRVDYRLEVGLRTRPDVVFTRARVAVYIDGCFWHGCPVRATFPVTNADYWLPKLARNIERDAASRSRLRELGWTVLSYWEHEDPQAVADGILRTVRSPHFQR